MSPTTKSGNGIKKAGSLIPMSHSPPSLGMRLVNMLMVRITNPFVE